MTKKNEDKQQAWKSIFQHGKTLARASKSIAASTT
jgi:hypothetical protein